MRSSSGYKGAIILRLMLVALLAWTVALGAPRQASACCGDGLIAGMATDAAVGSETATLLVEWGKNAVAWIKEFAFLADIINGINAFTETFKKEITTLGALINGGQQGLAELMIRVSEGLAMSFDQTAAAKVAAEIAGKHTPPTNDNQQLCNLVTAGSATGASMWTHQIIARATGDIIAQRYRGRGADGNGPQYAADERNIRCGKGAGGFPTGNPVDGYPAECVNKDPTLTDADIKYSTLSGLEVFQMPTLVPVPVTVFIGPPIITYVPKPVTRAEKLYVAALNFCAFAAGPRPSPPHGKDLESPEGIVQTASFDHATALESVYTTQCTRRVAYLTRPNCTDPIQSADPSIKKVCEATKKACEGYVASGGTLTPDIECAKGLSPRQEEWIKHMKCTTNQFYTSAAGAGVNHGMMMDFSTMCDLSNTTWQAKQADDEAALVAAMNGMQGMQDVYAGVGGAGAHTDRINAPADAPLSPRRRDEAALERPAKKVAVKASKGAGSGLPEEGSFAADRISLPVALAQ